MLIKGGTLHIGDGRILPDTDILVQNGKIAAIGTGLMDKEVIDASGKEVFPGFIDAADYAGCIDMAYHAHDYSENSSPVVPYVNIKHSVDPDEVERQEFYKSGITSMVMVPGNKNVIGGMVAVLKTTGININQMVVKEQAALKGSVINTVKETFGSRGVKPSTRMGMMNLLKETFAKYQKPEECGKLSYIEAKNRDIFQKVFAKEVPFVVAANTKAEIESVIEGLKPYDVKLAICNAYQAGQAKEAILEAKAAVILGEFSHMSSEVHYDTDFEAILELERQGIPVAISLLTDDNVLGRECLFWTVSKLKKAGAAEEQILRMLTVHPAEIFGIADVAGTLEVGKDADIVICCGNPIEACDAYVTETLIRGQMVYRKEEAVCC